MDLHQQRGLCKIVGLSDTLNGDPRTSSDEDIAVLYELTVTGLLVHYPGVRQAESK